MEKKEEGIWKQYKDMINTDNLILLCLTRSCANSQVMIQAIVKIKLLYPILNNMKKL
jgi:hypothetical protein